MKKYRKQCTPKRIRKCASLLAASLLVASAGSTPLAGGQILLSSAPVEIYAEESPSDWILEEDIEDQNGMEWDESAEGISPAFEEEWNEDWAEEELFEAADLMEDFVEEGDSLDDCTEIDGDASGSLVSGDMEADQPEFSEEFSEEFYESQDEQEEFSDASGSGGSLIPSERLTEEDITSIYGSGIDRSIDPEVDAVKEILRLTPADTGILQMAAEMTGKTREAAADAVEAVLNGQLSEIPDLAAALGEMVLPVSDEDRQNGTVVPFVPSDKEEESMVHLSSFVLTKVRDGAGDYDDVTDLNGNDSADDNGIIRTNDDLSYVMSYSTSLGDGYLYHTICGTRLYVEYVLPVSSREAGFHLEAMPWLKGDGPGDTPILTEDASGQRLVGYRELPDRRDENGNAYDVPGAGTVNCVICVKQMKSGAIISPSFSAWIERAGDNSSAAAGTGSVPADIRSVDPDVMVSVGPYLKLRLMSVSSVSQTAFGFDPKEDLLDVKTGAVLHLTGSSRAFYYRIECGKPNGSIKGTDYLRDDRRIHVEFKTSCGVSVDTKKTEIGLYNIRTFSMRTDDGRISGVLRDESGVANASYASGNGTIEKSSLTIKDGVIGFDITGFQKSAPGEVITQGVIKFIQKEENAKTGEEKPTYWTKLTATDLKGSCVLSGEGQELTFPVDTEWTIERQMERNGQFDSHLLLSSSLGLAHRLTTGDNGTDARTGYASKFAAYISVSTTITDPVYLEGSRDYFMLWDNRKVAVRGGAGCVLMDTLETDAVYRYITKADGSLWKSDKEMLSVDFTSKSMYEKVKVWPDYDSAVAFLSGKHPDEPDPSVYLCGFICETHRIVGQEVGAPYYRRVGIKMKVREIPENIRTTAMFLQALRCYSGVVKTSYSGADGIGADPARNEDIVIRKWNLSPMEYEKSAWDDSGVLEESSLTVLNTSHKGNTLYIEPYIVTVKEHFPDGLEAKTFDLSEAGNLEVRIQPGFEDGPEAEDASFVLTIPNLMTDRGEEAVTGQKLYLCGDGGKKIECTDGAVIELGSVMSSIPGSAKVSSGPEGYEIRFEGLNTAQPLPEFVLSGAFNKDTLDASSSITHASVVSGDGLNEKPSAANGHMASVGAAFVEINANALKIEVDRAVTANGEEFEYTITYTNLYDRDHELNLTDLFPYHADSGEEDVPPHIAGGEADLDLASDLSPGATLSYVGASANSRTSEGSKVSIQVNGSGLTAKGTLRSGETAVITYRMKVEGAGSGDLIRNSCVQRDEFGEVFSNRVETTVFAPDLTAPMSLMTGGPGVLVWYLWGFLLLILALSARVVRSVRR